MAGAATAFDPPTHFLLTKEAVTEAPDGPYKQIAMNNLPYYLAGSEANDITVLFYFGTYKAYTSTHNWEYCQKMLKDCAPTEQTKAFALGCFAHLSADSYSHNVFVPNAIKQYTFLDEASLHPMVEEALGEHYLALNPTLQAQVNKMLDVYTDPAVAKEIQCTIGSDSIGGVKITDLMAIHKSALGDFTNKAYGAALDYNTTSAGASSISKLSIFWGMFKFVNKPVAKYVLNVGDTNVIESNVKQRIQDSLAGTPDTQYDPSGSNNLSTANYTPQVVQVVLIIILASLVLLFLTPQLDNLLDSLGKAYAISSFIALLMAFAIYYAGLLGFFLTIFFVWSGYSHRGAITQLPQRGLRAMQV